MLQEEDGGSPSMRTKLFCYAQRLLSLLSIESVPKKEEALHTLCMTSIVECSFDGMANVAGRRFRQNKAEARIALSQI
jgi:hypothetical protein